MNNRIIRDCAFIDAGSRYIEDTTLVGRTTDIDFTPDSGILDIGFHHSVWGWWDYVNGGEGLAAGDINQDAVTDWPDLQLLAHNWLASEPNDANDINNDGIVNFKDFAILAQTWFKIQGHPNIRPVVSGDPNSSYVNIGIANYGPGTWRAFLLVDGRYIGELYWFKGGEPIPLDVSALGNGTHKLKVVAVRVDGDITVSDVSDNVFNSPLQYCISEEAYDFNEPHHFCGYYSGPNDIAIKVYNEANDLVWSQTYSPQNLNNVIPTDITSTRYLCTVVFQETLSGGKSIAKPLAVKFDAAKAPAGVRGLIIAPNWWRAEFVDYYVIEAVMQTFDEQLGRNNWAYLTRSQATYENLKWYAENRNINYIYYCYHGGFRPEECHGALRTAIRLSDGNAVSVKYSDPGRPVWCEPDGLAPNFHSIHQIGFDPGELKFVHFDCCYTGRLRINGSTLEEGLAGDRGLTYDGPHSDMSWALHMVSDQTQCYQGWWDDVPRGGGSKFNIFSYQEWLGFKEGNDIAQAIERAIKNTDYTPPGTPDPHYTYRLKGQGLYTEVKIH